MFKVAPILAFTDNYIWLISNPDTKEAWVVDPGDAQPVLDKLAISGEELAGILITHHHPDHTGGIAKLLEHKNVPVYGPANDKIKEITNRVKEGDTVEAAGSSFKVIEIPGHTLDHIAFVYDNAENPAVFCGDTLFAGGCGRVFEGTAEQMHGSLSKLAALHKDTQVYCAHEYTQSNLYFAREVSPDEQAIRDRLSRTATKRRHSRPTVPTPLSIELETNPFLRCDDQDIKASIETHSGKTLPSPVEVFAEMREWKNNFVDP
ncbi:MAG: hydroxyacylglutathione hydrolase [Pseudomonadales bacterium]|nr:hydroxyacylglutathione hydrolase [Pseudomonadales bacterium]